MTAATPFSKLTQVCALFSHDMLPEWRRATITRAPEAPALAFADLQPAGKAGTCPALVVASQLTGPARTCKKPYSDGVRRLLVRYAIAAGLANLVSPHRPWHFLLTWLKKQGIDDALIQPYSGHAANR